MNRLRGIWGALLMVGLVSGAATAQLLSGPSSLELCDVGTFVMSFTNSSPTQTACQIVFRNTPPSAEYEFVPGSGAITLHTGETRAADPVLNAWDLDSIVGGSYELPPGETATLEFELATTCLAVSGTDLAEVDYIECAQPGVSLHVTDSHAVEILPGAVAVIKTPASPSAGVGDLVTWTLEVRSTGLGSIRNVLVTDTLGAGLEYVSSSPSGSEAGGIVTWDSGSVPGLADIDPDDSVFITLVARVVACTGLGNELDAKFGCDDGELCADTATNFGECGCGTATSSVSFVQRLPFLEFAAPSIVIPYCATTTTVTIPVINTGDGTAHDGVLCATGLDAMIISNVQGGATYSGGCFNLPDIAGGSAFDLIFDVTFNGDWCATTPSGTPLYTLEYTNDCGVLHRAQPQFGSVSASAAPRLTLSKSGPAVVGYGQDVTYEITASYTGPTGCGSGSTGLVTVTDTLPDGFPVIATGGGTWTPGPGGTGGTVVWTFDPSVTSVVSWQLIVSVPLDCDYCYTEQTNEVTATALSCCGCVLTASATSTTAVTCDRLYTSDYTISSSTLERCGDSVTLTDAHPFADDPALDTITFSDFSYAFLKENGLAVVPGSASASIDGIATPVSVTDGPTSVEFRVMDTRSVRGHTLTFTYDLQATSTSTPTCGASSSFYVWMSHEIPSVGPCTLFYDTVQLTLQPPAMSVSVSGVPTIQEDCATYPVTISFARTSSVAVPYDARLVLTGTAGVLADFAGATGSGVAPSEPPIVGANTVEWRFADGFSTPGSSASLTVPVTTKCGGPLAALSAVGTYDDLCTDDDGYDDTCSVSGSDAASLRLSGDVYITMTPEAVYTTQRSVTWRIELYNSSNGTAYNVYVDDLLGSGLAYASSSASGYSGALTTQPNQDHSGGAINGASFLFERIEPGERPVIQFTADLVSCSNLTHAATVGWGCGGASCQPERSDSSYVLVAPASVVATSLAPTPLDACAVDKATITLRSSGIATAYDLVATATLPTGLSYLGNAEYRVSGGPWNPAAAPNGAPGPTLTWDGAQVPALAAVAAGTTVEIRFDVAADCGFNGGTLQARSSYENPCGQVFLSGIGSFTIATRKPSLSLTVTQTSPAPGQPIACDGTVTWQIRVSNGGPAVASVVWVEATLGAGVTYASSTGGVDGGHGSGQDVTWEIADLGVGETETLTVTAASASCGPLSNSVRAYWACGGDGSSASAPSCLSSSYASGSATATRTISLSSAGTLSPTSIGACADEATLTLTLTNNSTSAPAYSPDVKITLPAGLAYLAGSTEIDCGSGFAPAANPVQAGQVLTWYSTSASGPGNDLCSTIPPGGEVAVRFGVSAACYRTTASATIDTYAYDCCSETQVHTTSTVTLTAAPPTLSVTKTPSTTVLDCANPGSTVTWTITVTNTGASIAEFVRIIDTLGADLVRVSGGTQIGANPQQWGWEIGPLAPGGSQSVQLGVRLAPPPDNCTASRRTGTAVTTWGCTLAALDGDPNTTAEYLCTSSGGSVTRTATVTVPDLSISASDISPQFTCESDGISDGRLLLTVRNAGTAAISSDFTISFSESTTGWTGSGTFTSLGGTLPLAAGGSQVLTLSGWPIACSSCSYTFAATLDTGGLVCECRENNNIASLVYTPTIPDVVVHASTLAPSCAGDGQLRIQGSVTLRNQGCGASSLTTNIPMRFTVFAGASCGGTVLDQWTQTFTGVSLAAGGGTQAFAVDRTTTANACSPCEISVQIEADDSNTLCECSGTNNTFCATALPVAFPDLIASGIDFAGLGCTGDTISGLAAVTVTNTGCGSAGAFDVGLATSGCLAFASQRVTSLAAGASVVVQFPVAGAWSGCATCDCTFTATVDTGNEVCECTGTNNTGTAVYTSPLPDLVITTFTASAPNPCLPGSAQVTVRNSGCGIAPSGVVVGITGAATGQASTTVALAAGESETITVPFAAPVGCGSGYAVTATADPANAVCECTGANNTASTTFSVSAPDLAVSNVGAVCNLDDTFTVTASIRNTGGQTATGVSIRVYADGTRVHEETQSIDAGATYSLSYTTPPLLCATPHAIRVVADEAGVICECSEADNEASIAAALCTCPALTTAKSITNVWRSGASIWPTSTVESGDVVEYMATITNNGAAIAFHVDLADTLPDGLVYHTAAPGHNGEYTLSAGGSGTFPVPAGGSTFTTSLHATLAVGASLTLRYCAIAQSTLEQGDILTNIVTGDGQEGSGRDIPAGSASVTIEADRPALKVNKTIADVLRGGSSVGTSGPVEPGDLIVYRFVVRNVGEGTAYAVSISDTLPTGLLTETAAPGSAGTYTVSAPASSGSLGLTSGLTSFTAAVGAALAGGGTLTADYTARVTSAAVQGIALVNVAQANGVDNLGAATAASNAAAGDLSDDDAEDPDADDTGIASIDVAEPALSVDKRVVDVRRGGSSIGVVDPLLYGDLIIYRIVVRNVGEGTAYAVELEDDLPTGIVVDTSGPQGSGTYSVSAPVAGGSLGLADGAGGFSTSLDATVAGGETLTVEFAARVTLSAPPGVSLTNVATATGEDGFGTAIPISNAALGDTNDDDAEDSDPDDTGIATIRVGAPALVTEKRIDRVLRGARPVSSENVEPGDVVAYTLVVRNVGSGPALNVSVVDTLPEELDYRGPTNAAWPRGSSTVAPAGAPGPTLTWSLGAALEPGEALTLSYEAKVSNRVRQGLRYENTMLAAGEDAAGAAIPADARDTVPEDDDLDDASSASLQAVQPALVTEKRVLDVVRGGTRLGATAAVREGDLVTFELVVQNVGLGTAYDVDVRDALPPPFTYVSGTTDARWPLGTGTATADPLGGPSSLWWPLDARLAPDNVLTLRFQARVNGPTRAGTAYENRMSADGFDGDHNAIPANASASVRADTDLDDQDDAVLFGAADVPALVTHKSVSAVLRDGRNVADDRVELGDTVRFALVVRNVGTATAFSVDVSDRLPPEMSYVRGSARVTTPDRIFSAEPSDAGDSLLFDLDATLAIGQALTVHLDAVVDQPVVDGRRYVNRLQATGRDADGAVIAPDQRSLVPDDVDADDADTAAVIARSWLADGAGGVVEVPVLRKTAETLGSGGCLGIEAVAGAVWFQTDIALFAASEFASFAAESGTNDRFPDTLLPTWTRTVAHDLGQAATDNVLQVAVLSSIGVPLERAPRIAARAEAAGISLEAALAERLAELAAAAGLSTFDSPPAGRWIALEYAGGEPVFEASRDSTWGASGQWTEIDRRIVASNLGMGLLSGAQAAAARVTSQDAADRYTGWVLAEGLANKLQVLEGALLASTDGATTHVAHEAREREATGELEILDDASVLFDQVALIWGAARTLAWVRGANDWPAGERELASSLEAGAASVLDRAARAIAVYHAAPDGEFYGRSPSDAEPQRLLASTIDVALLLIATDEAADLAGVHGDVASRLRDAAEICLAKRQRSDGTFVEPSTTAGVFTALASQFAGIYGSLVAGNVEAAWKAYDALERDAWDGSLGFGLYRLDRGTFCTTALDMGLAVGALRRLAQGGDAQDAAQVLGRLAAYVRSVVDDGALQLDNALTESGARIVQGDGFGTLFGVSANAGADFAPVLQRWLCLVETGSESACGGLRVLDDSPWYQTDIGMFGAYALQASGIGREDDADAHLVAVILHSGLGLGSDAIEGFTSLDGRIAASLPTAEVRPTLIPFFAGDPVIGREPVTGLAWNPATFDTRIVPSALGMTLLREAQETSQILASVERSSEDEALVRALVAGIAAQVSALEDLQVPGPDGVSYLPHVSSARTTGGRTTYEAVDRTSQLFDHASVLLGLCEVARLTADPEAQALLAEIPVDPLAFPGRIASLAQMALSTLETAHRRGTERVLADSATPSNASWLPGDRVSALGLGLVAEALEGTLDVFSGARSTEIARQLLEEGASFVLSHLWTGQGVYRERWDAVPVEGAVCEPPTLGGQLGALRSLLAAHSVGFADLSAEIRAAVLAFDDRFWNHEAEAFAGAPDLLSWCATPLELGLALTALPSAAGFAEPVDADRIRAHIRRHVGRTLDALDLQLPARVEDQEGSTLLKAPVLDRRACVEPASPYRGVAWTRPGDIVRYVMEAENPTAEAFYSVLVTDVLPPGVHLLSAEPAPVSVDGQTLVWTYDSLEAGEIKRWTLEVRIDEDRPLGETLTNCVTLSAIDARGEPIPPRQACADVSLSTADDAWGGALRDAAVDYRTHEAMRLSVALDDLVTLDGLGEASAEATAASLANLGVLLGESGLGVPLSQFAQTTFFDAPSLAREAGLPAPPEFGAPIVLPSSGGVPIVERGVGFVDRAEDVSPAALGWTLAREAGFLATPRGDGLAAYLQSYVSAAVDWQVEWLRQTLTTSADGTASLVHGTRIVATEQGVDFTTSDPRVLAADQASILFGLARITTAAGASDAARRNAGEMAGGFVTAVCRHVLDDGTVSATLESDLLAGLTDVVLVARGLAEAVLTPTERSAEAAAALAAIARNVLNLEPAGIAEAAARVEILLIAARALGDVELRSAGLAAWEAFAATARAADGRLVFSDFARLGWRYTPAEAALAFELLGEILASGHGEGVAQLAAELLRVDILGERVYLRPVLGYWRDHVGLACLTEAPAFVRHAAP
ncbi:MAG: CARDB domain-containing protein [Candidatus Bipolaricaulota bacterium]